MGSYRVRHDWSDLAAAAAAALQCQAKQYLRYCGPRKEERESDMRLTWKTKNCNFFNLGKKTDIQVQEAPSPKEDKSKDVQSKIHYN